MIKKEIIKTKDGNTLTRTFSDTEHKIRNIKTNTIYTEAVDISEDMEYEEVSDYIELDGPDSLDEINAFIGAIKQATKKINRIDLTDNEALTVKEMFPTWESKVGANVEAGYKLFYNKQLWRVRQDHLVQEAYPPSVDTAALYEVINYQHEGTLSDPIPYNTPMEIFNNKYYTQYDIVYKCIRDSQTALSHDLSSLVGLYVELV